MENLEHIINQFNPVTIDGSKTWPRFVVFVYFLVCFILQFMSRSIQVFKLD